MWQNYTAIDDCSKFKTYKHYLAILRFGNLTKLGRLHSFISHDAIKKCVIPLQRTSLALWHRLIVKVPKRAMYLLKFRQRKLNSSLQKVPPCSFHSWMNDFFHEVFPPLTFFRQLVSLRFPLGWRIAQNVFEANF